MTDFVDPFVAYITRKLDEAYLERKIQLSRRDDALTTIESLDEEIGTH